MKKRTKKPSFLFFLSPSQPASAQPPLPAGPARLPRPSRPNPPSPPLRALAQQLPRPTSSRASSTNACALPSARSAAQRRAPLLGLPALLGHYARSRPSCPHASIPPRPSALDRPSSAPSPSAHSAQLQLLPPHWPISAIWPSAPPSPPLAPLHGRTTCTRGQVAQPPQGTIHLPKNHLSLLWLYPCRLSLTKTARPAWQPRLGGPPPAGVAAWWLSAAARFPLSRPLRGVPAWPASAVARGQPAWIACAAARRGSPARPWRSSNIAILVLRCELVRPSAVVAG
jgi:hypothetical protein